MFRTSLYLFLSAAAFAQSNGMTDSRPGLPGTGWHMMGGTSTLKPNVILRYKTELTPGGNTGFGQAVAWISLKGDTVHRALVDKLRGTYFGYSMQFENGGNPNTFKVSFLPLSSTQLPPRLTAGGALKPLHPPTAPAPQYVEEGDLIKLDLMVSPDGKQALTDYIEILTKFPVPPATRNTAEPRDFTLDDGPVHFDTFGMKAFERGQWIAQWNFSARPGSTIWVAIPGQGRYLLSLTAHQGFTRGGVVRDNIVIFKGSKAPYELRFGSPIAGEGKAWNLYVMQDENYLPAKGWHNTIFGGVDRMENLLPKSRKAGDIL